MTDTKNNETKEFLSPDYKRKAILKVWGRIFLFIILVISLINLAGLFFNLSFLTGARPGWTATKPITAICFLLSVLAVVLIEGKKVRSASVLVNASGFLLILIGLITISLYIITLREGNEISFTASPLLDFLFSVNGRMALITAAFFLIVGIILFLIKTGNRALIGFAHGLAMIVFIVSYFVPVNYLLGVSPIYSIHFISVSIYTGLNFCLLSLAILFFYPGTWLMSVFTDEYSGGSLARRLTLVVIILPLLIAWLRVEGERAGLFESETGAVLVAMAYTICLLILVWFSSKRLIKTDKKQRSINDALRLSEEKFNAAFRSNPNAIVLSILETGSILEVNESFLSFFELRKESVIGKTTISLNIYVDAKDRNVVKNIMLREGRVSNLALKVKTSTGKERFVLISGESLEIGQQKTMILNFQDITELKFAENKLHESEERLRLLADNISQLVWITDREGFAVWLNKRWNDYTGYPLEEIRKGERFEVIHPDYINKVAESYNNAIRKGEPWEETFPLRGKNGEYRWFLSHAQPVRDETGNISMWFGTNTDVTEQKRAENEIRNKNEELTSFIYTVSHDLKSPLFTVQSFISFLVEHIEKNDKEAQLRDINFIQNATETMRQRLDELVELSKIGISEKEKTTVPFREIAQEALYLVAGRIKQRKVRIVCEAHGVMICGHKERLIQLFQNLFDNAVKFMGNQSEPVIKIGSLINENNQVVLFVKDNGLGIDPKYHHKVFGLFEKLDTKAEGTGIGLAIVKKIVEVHNGSIWVSSEGVGKGTTFYFTFNESIKKEEIPEE
jgi:PAS domain S-box-containing protein